MRSKSRDEYSLEPIVQSTKDRDMRSLVSGDRWKRSQKTRWQSNPNTIDRDRDLRNQPLKRPSLKGDYLAGPAMLNGVRAQSQKWYWIKEQKKDEVYFLQFFDNYAEKEGRPLGVQHCSPELLNIESGDTVCRDKGYCVLVILSMIDL
jgi:hypothetical protein